MRIREGTIRIKRRRSRRGGGGGGGKGMMMRLEENISKASTAGAACEDATLRGYEFP